MVGFLVVADDGRCPCGIVTDRIESDAITQHQTHLDHAEDHQEQQRRRDRCFDHDGAAFRSSSGPHAHPRGGTKTVVVVVGMVVVVVGAVVVVVVGAVVVVDEGPEVVVVVGPVVVGGAVVVVVVGAAVVVVLGIVVVVDGGSVVGGSVVGGSVVGGIVVVVVVLGSHTCSRPTS